MALCHYDRLSTVISLMTTAMTTLGDSLMRVVMLFDSFPLEVAQVLNPVWRFIGAVQVSAQTLIGYPAKAPFRLLVYDS